MQPLKPMQAFKEILKSLHSDAPQHRLSVRCIFCQMVEGEVAELLKHAQATARRGGYNQFSSAHEGHEQVHCIMCMSALILPRAWHDMRT